MRHEALLSLLDRPAILLSMVPVPQTNLWVADCAAEQTESRAEPVRLFAFQEPVDGGYRFVATCYSSMWQRYSTLDAPLRHFFEVGRRTQFIAHRLLCHSSLPRSLSPLIYTTAQLTAISVSNTGQNDHRNHAQRTLSPINSRVSCLVILYPESELYCR